MRRFWDTLKGYKEVIGVVAVIAAATTWMSHSFASDAEKKADAAAQAVLEVAKTQTVLAQTQQEVAREVAKQTGKIEGFLSTLNLSESQIKQLQTVPREPLKNAAGKIICGQTWLQVWPNLDTLVLYSITRDSCKVSASLVYPTAAK